MKNALLLVLFCTEISFAQLILPELSPEGKLIQQVGYTTFEVHYGRPAARERKIIGDLVPYKKLWRTGAGKCSTISFSREVVINNKVIPPGIYAIVSIPDEKEWTILLNKDTTKLYGDPSEYNPDDEVARLQVTSEKSDRFYESLTFDIDVVNYDAVLYLSWENTQIHFPIATRSHENAMAQIAKVLAENPEDQRVLAEASFYYYMNNENPQQILKWLDKALALGGERWLYQQKADVLVRLKRYADARKTARQAIAFLQETKPVEWQTEVVMYEEKMKRWPRQ